MNAGIGDVLNGRKHLYSACDPRPLRPDSRVSQLPRDVEGSSGPLLGMRKLESKRMRMSVNMGTKEARLSMVVTPLGRSSDRPKHLPMRQPSGGAPVVVGDVNDDSHGEGVQDNLCWRTEVLVKSGGFQMGTRELQRRLV